MWLVQPSCLGEQHSDLGSTWLVSAGVSNSMSKSNFVSGG